MPIKSIESLGFIGYTRAHLWGEAMTPVARFFEATWFLWWLFAAGVITRWCWVKFVRNRHGDGNGPTPWRELYRTALLERDTTKIAARIEEAEGAILLALAGHLFRPGDPERIALQDAMSNLRSLRENADLQTATLTINKDAHRSTRRNRPRDSWHSWRSVH